MNNRKNIFTLLRNSITIAWVAIFTLTTLTVSGQGWERFYGDTPLDEGTSVVQTRDGGFAMAGVTQNLAEVTRTDQNGNIEWQKTYTGVVFPVFDSANDIIQTTDGGFAIAGTTEGLGGRSFVLIKLDKDGNEQWRELYGGEGNDEAFSVIQTSDGGFVLAGHVEPPFGEPRQAFIVRINADRDIIWEQRLGGIEDDRAWSVIQTADLGFMISGEYETGISNSTDIYLIKLEASGLLDWENTYSFGDSSLGRDVVELPDGSFASAGSVGNEASLLKVNADGNLATIFTYGTGAFNAIELTADGNLIMTGFFEENIQKSKAYLVKTDFEGNLIWSKTYGRNLETTGILISSTGTDVKNTLDGGYVIAGWSSKISSIFDHDSYLIKVNSEGELYTNFIEGVVFDDINENCLQDANEPILEDWVIEASGEKSFYGTTDENGRYSILVANGDYEVSLFMPSDNYQPCFSSFSAAFSGTGDTITRVLPIQKITECPLMQVDISTTLLEKCHFTDYTVNYSNLGTAPAIGAEVKVKLDDFLMFNSAELPFTNEIIEGELYYVFDIGIVDPLERGRFKINVLVDCVEPQLEQTHCVTALIFPDTLCEAINPAWDGSSLQVNGQCDTDSVRFEIINVGDDMEQERNWIVIEDELMLFQVPQQTQLTANAMKSVAFEANGSTYRIIAEQSTDHPGSSFPTAAVEGCVSDNSTFNTGFHNMYPEDDNDLSKSSSCQVNVNAEDLADNFLNPYPTGYDDDNCITSTTELNYHIRFKNTSMEIADRVIIRDTLSELLDISTIEFGASSHDYTYEVHDERILKFTFDNIMLPNSGTDEPGSNGFVKFRISQKLDNEPGDVIFNSAAIYFDFDEWIDSNETFHTVCEGDWWDFLQVSTTTVFIPEVNIGVFPNPLLESATFQMTGMEFNEVEFKIYDLQGRLMKREVHNGNEFQFYRDQLSSGLYVYRIESEGQPVAVGKIVIE